MIDFFPTRHISSSNRRKFGICDRPAPAAEKAYIAERQGQDLDCGSGQLSSGKGEFRTG